MGSIFESEMKSDVFLSPANPQLVESYPPATAQRVCIPESVARHAAASPSAVAVSQGSDTLSYAELEKRSNQFAHFLRSVGVGSGDLVGIYLERSLSMVVAALAIIKAGGAYLPLQPGLPRERLTYMLQDAQARVVITRSGMSPDLVDGRCRVVAIDDEAEAIAKQSVGPPPCVLDDGNLAYVIYTSGSTGQPKGVEVLHVGLSNLVSWHLRAFEVTSRDRASHVAALGFDAAVWELWPYLVAGASVHLANNEVRQNPQQLRDWLLEEKITMAFLPTPLAESLLLLEWPKSAALRILLTGADTLHHSPPASLPFILVNNYGPTECTVVATSGRVWPASSSSSQPPSIGLPIDNTDIYILDEEMTEVASGKPGELYIGGAGVARGYRNQPELTKKKFVSNPFSGDPGDRLYRSGDQVRLLPSGELEFLGRFDEQIKIQGYRVEPNEIVSALDCHEDVQTSAVIARETQGGEKNFVAYVVLSENSKVTASGLREHLSQRLPHYMVPASFVRMEALPVTANGKVDRDALPPQDSSNRLPDEDVITPRTLVEQRLAAILAQLLHVQYVGLKDNFFLLGGHSLLGTQLLTRIRQAFGVDLTLLSLFDHPTLMDMSQEIEKLILVKLENIGDEQSKSLRSQTAGGQS
jgi:amino acid adenylation domain-containing protein